MKYELVEAGDASCTLKEFNGVSTSVQWPIPFAKARITDAISEILLASDDVKHIEHGDGLMTEIMREHVRIHVGGAKFDIRWRYVFGLLA